MVFLKKTLKNLVFIDIIHILQLSVRTRKFVHIHLTDSKVKRFITVIYDFFTGFKQLFN